MINFGRGQQNDKNSFESDKIWTDMIGEDKICKKKIKHAEHTIQNVDEEDYLISETRKSTD